MEEHHRSNSPSKSLSGIISACGWKRTKHALGPKKDVDHFKPSKRPDGKAANPQSDASSFAMSIPPAKRTSKTLLAVLALCAGLIVTSLSSASAAKDLFNKEPPVWQIHLKDFFKSDRPFQNCIRCTQIAFLSEDLLAVTFLTSEPIPTQPGRDGGIPSGPNGYRTLLFNVKTGLLRTKHDWMVPLGALKVIPTHDGNFLTQTMNEIDLYSNEFEQLQSLRLSEESFPLQNQIIEVSWDGQRIVIGSMGGSSLYLQMIDTDTFATLGTWTRELRSYFAFPSASGNTAAYAAGNEITILSNAHEPILMNGPFAKCLGIHTLSFVDETAFASTCFDQLQVSDLQGKELLREEFSKSLRFAELVASRSGSVMGVMVGETLTYIGAPIMDSPYSAIVYSTKTWAKIYERRFPGDSSQPIAEFALSPEGSFMAMLSKGHKGRSDGEIQVFHIPLIRSEAPISAQ